MPRCTNFRDPTVAARDHQAGQSNAAEVMQRFVGVVDLSPKICLLKVEVDSRAALALQIHEKPLTQP